jgi:hypothetical protein
MIGLCQEGKSSPDALRRSAGVVLSHSSPRVLASQSLVPILDRTRLPNSICFRASTEEAAWAGNHASIEPPICCRRPASGLAQKIELVLSCQSRNLSTGASEARAPSPSRLNGETWQATR